MMLFIEIHYSSICCVYETPTPLHIQILFLLDNNFFPTKLDSLGAIKLEFEAM